MAQMVAAQDKVLGIYGWSFDFWVLEPFRALEEALSPGRRP